MRSLRKNIQKSSRGGTQLKGGSDENSYKFKLNEIKSSLNKLSKNKFLSFLVQGGKALMVAPFLWGHIKELAMEHKVEEEEEYGKFRSQCFNPHLEYSRPADEYNPCEPFVLSSEKDSMEVMNKIQKTINKIHKTNETDENKLREGESLRKNKILKKNGSVSYPTGSSGRGIRVGEALHPGPSRTRKNTKRQGGGPGYRRPRQVFYGKAWHPGKVSSWPGAAVALGANVSPPGIPGGSYLNLSPWGIPAGVGGPASPNDPPVMSTNGWLGQSPMKGGKRSKKRLGMKRRRKSKRRYRGGRARQNTIIPQDIVNWGRQMISLPYSAVLGYQGKTVNPSIQPNPTLDQPIDQNFSYFKSKPANIQNIRNAAQTAVDKI